MYSREIVLSVLVTWFFLFLAGLYYITFRKRQAEIQQHLVEYGFQKVLRRFFDRWSFLYDYIDRLAPVGEKVQLLSDPHELKEHLVKAGNPFDLTVQRMNGAKILGALIGLVLSLFYLLLGLPLAPFIIVGLPLMGYMGPIFLIRHLAKQRQEKISYEIPDFLDMMSITLKAGMSLDEALNYYTSTTKGPLSEEVTQLNQEIRFGVHRETAYRNLLERTDSVELDGLVKSLIQALNLGTSVADVFTQQADEIRRMRAERAKEEAGKAGPKITIVSSLVIMPSILILVIGVLILYYTGDNSPFKMGS